MSNQDNTPTQAKSITTDKYNRDFVYHIPGRVLFDKTLKPIDLKVYAIVRSFMDTTGEAYPSNGWFANKLDIDPTTASRSLTRLEKGCHIKRTEIDGRRYLLIGKPIPESVVSQQGGGSKDPGGVDQMIKGGRSNDQGGVDQMINQLDQSTIASKNISARAQNFLNNKEPATKGWIQGKQELQAFYEQELLPRGIDIKWGDLDKLCARYGLDYLKEKLLVLESKGDVDNKAAYYTAAVRKDYPLPSQPKRHSARKTFAPGETTPEQIELSQEQIARKQEIDKAGMASLKALKKKMGYLIESNVSDEPYNCEGGEIFAPW